MHLTLHSNQRDAQRSEAGPRLKQAEGFPRPKSNSKVDDRGWEKDMEKEEKACRVRKWHKMTKTLGD